MEIRPETQVREPKYRSLTLKNGAKLAAAAALMGALSGCALVDEAAETVRGVRDSILPFAGGNSEVQVEYLDGDIAAPYEYEALTGEVAAPYDTE